MASRQMTRVTRREFGATTWMASFRGLVVLSRGPLVTRGARLWACVHPAHERACKPVFRIALRGLRFVFWRPMDVHSVL